jgi:hypothetical protein
MFGSFRQTHLLQQHVGSLLHLFLAQFAFDPHRQLDILVGRHQSQQVKGLKDNANFITPQSADILVFVGMVHFVPFDGLLWHMYIKILPTVCRLFLIS